LAFAGSASATAAANVKNVSQREKRVLIITKVNNKYKVIVIKK